uniref:Phospholipid phosphatase related 2b n=1 Tax=Eptatretus burgeri TaxID=7764 RepID=A0A8C4NF15_EPTBU
MHTRARTHAHTHTHTNIHWNLWSVSAHHVLYRIRLWLQAGDGRARFEGIENETRRKGNGRGGGGCEGKERWRRRRWREGGDQDADHRAASLSRPVLRHPSTTVPGPLWVVAMPRDPCDVQKSNSILPCFIFVEMVVMAAVVMAAYYLEFTDTLPARPQGFFCRSPGLARPDPGPEQASAVPPALLLALSIGLPAALMFVGEVSSHVFSNWGDRGKRKGGRISRGTRERTIVTGDCCYINPLVRRLVRFLGVFAFGYFSTVVFANVCQVVTGSLAPHFLSVCRPNLSAVVCRDPPAFAPGPSACSGQPGRVAMAARSFPCKEAAIAMYSALFTALYITGVGTPRGSRLLRPSLGLVALGLAAVCGAARVAECRNHWQDVAGGFVIGGGIAIFLNHSTSITEVT